MPELPEVETVLRGLAPRLLGRRFVHVVQRRPDLRTRLPRDFVRRVEGRRIDGAERRAKYILLRFDDGNVLVLHLGMSGRLVLLPRLNSPPGPHDHVEFTTDEGAILRFTDPRRFGLIDLVSAADLGDDKRFNGLGPEPLSSAFTPEVLAAALAGRTGPIKTVLIDQRVVAGLGNIYACEALFHAGLSPRRRARTVRGDHAHRLVAAIKDVLSKAIVAGGSSARDYVQASGELGWFQHYWAVYDREGKPCPGCDCRGAVKRIVQGGRSTFYCTKRQR
ncbi:MAG: bifunctional DNA-formamidopyrimidine glycosylase/DNA-(apurinic or apyrimidinic site) lyase [Proteobacteria bacterium]|nr:bifunctional DNA-formamidopyrimidine glycosylase/DNA-(apurinic or apyrimidinic site) lyase [Pseudomonadota bacterium]